MSHSRKSKCYLLVRFSSPFYQSCAILGQASAPAVPASAGPSVPCSFLYLLDPVTKGITAGEDIMDYLTQEDLKAHNSEVICPKSHS